MPQKTYLNILKFGVYFSFVCSLFVFSNLLFPFITSKQIPFNMLVELLFVFWLAFILKYPDFRPRGSHLSFGLGAFFSILLLSCFTGVDFNLSFWGDVERMLGVFHLLHFFALYLIIITVFRRWKDWKTLLMLSVVISTFISIKGITGISYSTVGNTSYVSGLIIFNLYFVFLLFFREQDRILRWLYLIPVPLMLYAFNVAGTTGALVGLGSSVIALSALYALLNKNKKIRIGGLILGILVVSLFGSVLANRDQDWVKNNRYLREIIQIDLRKNTFQTRLLSWKAALKDFKEHPILGAGHGNYAIVFDKHFDPVFYEYTSSETYFDRAHNNLVDIASTAGLAGILAYLYIFGALAFYLVRGYVRKKIGIHEFILISCLVIAYFVQNLAVFDSFVTYMALMVTLGYVYWLDRRGEEDETGENARLGNEDYYVLSAVLLMSFVPLAQAEIRSLAENNMRVLWIFMLAMAAYAVWAIIRGQKGRYAAEGDEPLANKEIYAIVGAGFLIAVIMYQYNILPLKMLVGTIDGQRVYASGDIAKTVEVYKEALSYDTVLDRDSRTSLNRIFAGGPGVVANIERQKAGEMLDYNIGLAEENVAYNPADSLNQMMLAQVLNTAAAYYSGDQEKFRYYSDRALEAINKSIEASPGRLPIYYQKAQIYINRGQKDEALAALKFAYSLNDDYPEAVCYLARAMLFYQEEEGYGYMEKCMDLRGLGTIPTPSLIQTLVNHYAAKEDWPRVTVLYERLTQLEPKNTKYWINLAKLYAQAGENDKARQAAGEAITADPSVRQYAEEFMAGLGN